MTCFARNALFASTCRLVGAAVLGLALASTSQAAGPVVVDTSGVQSVNLLGEAGNTVLQIDIGAHTRIDSLSWQLWLEALAPSALSEMQVSFGSSSGLDAVTLAPAALAPASGTGMFSGSVDLAGLGLAVGADGLLRIEFSEAYKDFADGTVEGRWLGGTLSFGVSAVPEPGAAVLALAGLLGLAAWRRTQRRPG